MRLCDDRGGLTIGRGNLMNSAMRALLEEEELRFTSHRGGFDLDQIEAEISALGCSFRDQAMPSMFVVASSQQERDRLQTQRNTHPEAGFPYVLLIQLSEEEVLVSPSPEGELAVHSARFIRWLAGTFSCTVTNDCGTDITARLAEAASG